LTWQSAPGKAFDSAGLEYRVVAGFATCLYVEEVEPDAGHLTTAEIEAGLSSVLRGRLARVRARERDGTLMV
jgi:hypothetical protein